MLGGLSLGQIGSRLDLSCFFWDFGRSQTASQIPLFDLTISEILAEAFSLLQLVKELLLLGALEYNIIEVILVDGASEALTIRFRARPFGPLNAIAFTPILTGAVVILCCSDSPLR